MNSLLTLLFFCSGATALIYEIAWSKYLALMFGSTVQAQTTVLAVFMGGLALGNQLFGSRADSLKAPIATYGYLEIAIGLYALLFNFFYSAADTVFVKGGVNLLEARGQLLVLKAALSVLLLLGPTILMGGTLPLLAAWLQKRSGDAGKSSARFYAVNTFGAVAGAGLAGFVLVRHFGMTGTLLISGVVNILIGAVAIYLSRRQTLPSPTSGKVARPKPTPKAVASSAATPGVPVPADLKIACILVFSTGAISMGLEVLASRSLSMIFGGSLQAFSVMLIAFILGIGLGGLAIASLRKPKLIAQRTIVFLLLGAAAIIGLFLVGAEQAALLYVRLRNGVGEANKYLWHQIASAGISIVALGLPAALIGAVLPLWIRLHSQEATLGKLIGRLLTWNTLGAVTGALATGFVLMPAVGLRVSFGILGVLLCLVAGAVAWRTQMPKGVPVSLAAAVALIALSTMGKMEWQYALSSGVFREREARLDSNYFLKIQQRDKLLFYKDGTDATVAVITDRKPTRNSDVVLSINGKPDGSAIGDLSTEYLLGHLPMLMRPDSKDVFVLGFGTGITSGALLGHPISSLTIAENCEPVLQAGEHFAKQNRGVLTNQLAKIYREDARTVLKLSPKLYDIIISEPSNPWTAAIGSVFSQQFYELAASRLKEGGIMAQWFHMYEMNDEIVALVLRTFHSVFPSFEIWETRNGDLILLGSKKPWNTSSENFKEVFARPQPKSDLAEIGFRSPETIWTRQVVSQNTADAIISEGRVQSDLHPILEYEAPKAFYEGSYAWQLFVFDERLFQATFAPVEKQRTLVDISRSTLATVFGKYGSANALMMQYIKWRTQPNRSAGGEEVYDDDPFLESIFRKPESYPREARIAQDASTTYAMFQAAEALTFQQDRWREGVEKIDTLLRNYDPNHWEDGKIHPRPENFAAVAAKARYRGGDAAGALETVKLGMKLSPEDPQLHYLKRLLERTPAMAQN